MFDTLRMLIADSLPAVPDLDPPIDAADIRVAAAALLLAMASADTQSRRDERVVMLRALTTWFGVDQRGAMELLEAAEDAWRAGGTTDGFIRQLSEEYDPDQRLILADLLWEVARADGWLDARETALASQLTRWLGVGPTAAAHPPTGG
ncbi:MAG: TerB family tellurite resistance protein [Gemmatimonadetes bacterium]|nr:TerB family tellurite resistance protein [Gemmatimonadota bacterium]